MSVRAAIALMAVKAEAVLPTTITSTMLQGVLDEVIGVLPTVLPVNDCGGNK